MSGVKLDVGMLLGGGAALLRRRPGAVLVWTLIYVAGIAGADLMTRQTMLANPSGGGGGFSLFLIQLLLALISPLLLTAAMRALARPRETEFASLDAGVDELRVIGLFLILSIFFSIILGISRLALGWMAAATMSQAVALVVLLVPLLAFACLFARLSLAFPLAMIRKRIRLEEAWELSSRHFWPLFQAYAMIAVGMILLSLAISAVTDWWNLAMLFAGGPPLRIIVPVDGLIILGWVLDGALTTLGVVFAAGVMVAGANALVPDEKELTETFS
jgi:hypothetical protein